MLCVLPALSACINDDSLPPLPVQAGTANGSAHCMRLTGDGTLFALGANHRGQLGMATDSLEVAIPQRVPNLPPLAKALAGNAHSVLLTRDGRVIAFGENRHGQLGREQPSFTSTPMIVSINERITGLESGGAHVLALGASGKVYGWGSNEEMQLGLNVVRTVSQPVLLQVGAPAIALVAWGAHSAVLTSDGALNIFGRGKSSRDCCWPGANTLKLEGSVLQLISETKVLHQIAVPPSITVAYVACGKGA